MGPCPRRVVLTLDVQEVRLPLPDQLIDLLGSEVVDELDLEWGPGKSEDFAEGGFLHTGEVVLHGSAVTTSHMTAPQHRAAGGQTADDGVQVAISTSGVGVLGLGAAPRDLWWG